MMNDYRGGVLRLHRQGTSTSSIARTLWIKRDMVKEAEEKIIKAYCFCRKTFLTAMATKRS